MEIVTTKMLIYYILQIEMHATFVQQSVALVFSKVVQQLCFGILQQSVMLIYYILQTIYTLFKK